MPKLPFKLFTDHKSITKSNWKGGEDGLICTDEEFDAYYAEFIYLTNCDLCGEFFKSSQDRQMDHDHHTREFRNFVCKSCNLLKADREQSNNTSGYTGITKELDTRYNQGYYWKFEVILNGKQKKIKSSIDKEKLIEFATQWKLDKKMMKIILMLLVVSVQHAGFQ